MMIGSSQMLKNFNLLLIPQAFIPLRTQTFLNNPKKEDEHYLTKIFDARIEGYPGFKQKQNILNNTPILLLFIYKNCNFELIQYHLKLTKMASILDLLNSDIGKTLIDGTSKQLGQDKAKTAKALNAALPLLLGAMKNNAKTPQGAIGLLSALGNEKHGGSILDNLGSILGGKSIDKDVLQDGAGILGHLFNGKEKNVASAVSKTSGLDAVSAMNTLKVAAPVLMGLLGKESRQKNVTDQNGIGNLLSGLLGGESQQQVKMVTRLLDADNDGSIIDDVAGMLLGGRGSSKGGVNKLLGKLLGKK